MVFLHMFIPPGSNANVQKTLHGLVANAGCSITLLFPYGINTILRKAPEVAMTRTLAIFEFCVFVKSGQGMCNFKLIQPQAASVIISKTRLQINRALADHTLSLPIVLRSATAFTLNVRTHQRFK